MLQHMLQTRAGPAPASKSREGKHQRYQHDKPSSTKASLYDISRQWAADAPAKHSSSQVPSHSARPISAIVNGTDGVRLHCKFVTDGVMHVFSARSFFTCNFAARTQKPYCVGMSTGKAGSVQCSWTPACSMCGRLHAQRSTTQHCRPSLKASMAGSENTRLSLQQQHNTIDHVVPSPQTIKS